MHIDWYVAVANIKKKTKEQAFEVYCIFTLEPSLILLESCSVQKSFVPGFTPTIIHSHFFPTALSLLQTWCIISSVLHFWHDSSQINSLMCIQTWCTTYTDSQVHRASLFAKWVSHLFIFLLLLSPHTEKQLFNGSDKKHERKRGNCHPYITKTQGLNLISEHFNTAQLIQQIASFRGTDTHTHL